MLKEEQYTTRKADILKKFSHDFVMRNVHNPLFRAMYEVLAGTDDPYTILENLLTMNLKQAEMLNLYEEHSKIPTKQIWDLMEAAFPYSLGSTLP